MNRPLKYLYRVSVVLAVWISIEFGTGYWITHLANSEQFDRFASFEQYAKRHGESGFSPHRFTGYFGTPGWRNASDQHNILGYRGDEISVPKLDGTFRIVCLGSSATYGTGVNDYHLSYPYLLQKELQARGYARVEVINGGIPGYTTWESLLEFQFLVLDLSPDLILVYPGTDDISARLVWPPSAYRGDNTGQVTAPIIPKVPLPEYSNTLRVLMIGMGWGLPMPSPASIWTPRVETSYDLLFAQQWQAGTYPQGFFREVSAEDMFTANPPIYFERNIRSLVSTARVNGVGVVLTTVIATSEFSDNPQAASPEYQSALLESNQILNEIAALKDVPLIDLAKTFPTETKYFIDGIVFTSEGNQIAAERIASYLIENGLIPP